MIFAIACLRGNICILVLTNLLDVCEFMPLVCCFLLYFSSLIKVETPEFNPALVSPSFGNYNPLLIFCH